MSRMTKKNIKLVKTKYLNFLLVIQDCIKSDMKFKDLFRFEKKEIDHTFQNVQQEDKTEGLKQLQSPIQKESQEFGKLLIIASRKVGQAHKRNRIRRQLKSIFYQEKLFKKPVNSIMLIYKSALNLTFEELKQFLIKNLKFND